MTQNMIDLPSIALTLSDSSHTASPGNIEVCGNEAPFEKSLESAMYTDTTPGDNVDGDAGQSLPCGRQELPSDDVCSLGLDGLQEVRALADAIAGNANSVSDKHSDSLMPRDTFNGAAASLTGTSSTSRLAEQPLSADPKLTMQDQSDTLNVMAKEAKTVGLLASLTAENRSSNEHRQSLTDNQNGISLAAQANSKPMVHVKEIQPPQPPMTSKAPDVLSSAELTTHLRVLRSSGGGEARLQLHPAELGRMTVTLTTEGNETRVAFVVDNTQARQAVEASLARLRDVMDGAGLNLTDANVSERDSEKGSSQSGDQASEGSGSNSSDNGNFFDESSVSTSAQLVDAFA